MYEDVMKHLQIDKYRELIINQDEKITELEKACEETQELLDKQIEATYRLDKENAELKDYRLTTLAKQQTGMSKYSLNLEHKLSWYDDQLTKAKGIIQSFVWWHTGEDRGSIDSNAEQFLREVEK